MPGGYDLTKPEPFRCRQCRYTTQWRESYIHHLNEHAETAKTTEAARIIAEDLDAAYRSGQAKDWLQPQPPAPSPKLQSQQPARPNQPPKDPSLAKPGVQSQHPIQPTTLKQPTPKTQPTGPGQPAQPPRPDHSQPPPTARPPQATPRSPRLPSPPPASGGQLWPGILALALIIAAIVAVAVYYQKPQQQPPLTPMATTPLTHQPSKAPNPGIILASEPANSSPTAIPPNEQPPQSIPAAIPATAPPPGHVLRSTLQDMMTPAPQTKAPSPTARPTRRTPPTTVPVTAIPPRLVPAIIIPPPTRRPTPTSISIPPIIPPTTLVTASRLRSKPQPTAMPTSTPAPTPTATPTPEEKLREQRAYLMALVNSTREKAGLPAVTLGNNKAAQEHAEAMLWHGFTGHWGLDGLTPAMRYTLAGGVNYMKENTSGVIGIKHSEWGPQYKKQTWRESLNEIHQGLLNSSGHLRNILDKWHRKLSLGIACNKYTCSVVQNFEGDYVEFTQIPHISKAGVLTFAGKLKHGFTMTNVHVWYHETPHPLTLGQLDATYSYSTGQEPAIFITEPAKPGYYYSDSDLLPSSYTWASGVDPYSVDPEAPRDRSSALGLLWLIPLYEANQKAVPWTAADKWSQGASINVRANIRKATNAMGPGVYIILIWGTNGEETIPLTNYAVFVD